MPDVHAALFQYGDIPVYMRLNLGTESPEIYRFQGSKGILELTEFSLTFYPQSGLDTAPSYYASGFPRAMLSSVTTPRWPATWPMNPTSEKVPCTGTQRRRALKHS